jgi:uncharacterized membrane protein
MIFVMKRWTKTGLKVHWRITIVLALIFWAALMSVSAGAGNATDGQWLSLNVYLDNTGKALVTGYAEDVSGLDFLNNSQSRFENDTGQLYALTDGLTTKVGDLWTLRFAARGSFDDYRVSFYLPSDMRLGMINASAGLGYLLSVSNESLVADVQGYEVSNPTIAIEYQQPLAASGSLPSALPPGGPGNSAGIIMLLAAGLLVAVLALAIVMWRRKNDSQPNAFGPADRRVAGLKAAAPHPVTSGTTEPLNPSADRRDAVSTPDGSTRFELQAEDNGVYLPETSCPVSSSPEDQPGSMEPSIEPPLSPSREDALEDAVKNGIVISSEMEAVMQTLTAREQAVMTALIDHGGRMTQAEIRYETRTPKSSLTGILISLERRKLVTKKEWGRTNIIELSQWFLSKKERS